MRSSIEHRKNTSSVWSEWICSTGANRDQPMLLGLLAQQLSVTVPCQKVSSTATGKKRSPLKRFRLRWTVMKTFYSETATKGSRLFLRSQVAIHLATDLSYIQCYVNNLTISGSHERQESNFSLQIFLPCSSYSALVTHILFTNTSVFDRAHPPSHACVTGLKRR